MVRKRTSEYGYDEEFVGYTVVPGATVPDGERKALSQALDMHERACAPMPGERIQTMLAELKMLTQSRPEDQRDLEFRLAIYADRLAEYPADVVAHVLRTQPNISRWWPAWAELADRLDMWAKRRLARRDALRALIAPIAA